jgi:hypothetical protein
MEKESKRWLRVTLVTALAVTAVGALTVLLVRDQIQRHQKNLFHPHALRRAAALEHISRQGPSIDHLNVLRDYVAWEPRKLLRNRAEAILEQMLAGLSVQESGMALVS